MIPRTITYNIYYIIMQYLRSIKNSDLEYENSTNIM
jgi:hypothetical protein